MRNALFFAVSFVLVAGCTNSTDPTAASDAGNAADAGETGSVLDAGADVGTVDAGSTVDAASDTGLPETNAGSPITATVDGWPFADARSVHATAGSLAIDITEGDATCAAVASPYNYGAGSKLIHLTYTGTSDPGSSALAVGQGAAIGVTAEYVTHDGACAASIAKAVAGGGTVTFSAIQADRIAGTFDVTIGQASFKGTFDAPVCSGADAGAPACP